MSETEHIVISGQGTISPVGWNAASVDQAYRNGITSFSRRDYQNMPTVVATLPAEANDLIARIATEKKAYQGLDRSVLMAIYAGREAVRTAGWENQPGLGINLGSSRGATGLFEEHLGTFLAQGKVSAQTSPVTTLGNISSWLANDLQTQGPVISHSVTCSSALQALANAFAWLKSGLATRFLAGGAEAPLTAFTLAQMKAFGIYSQDLENPFPCRPHNQERRNTFVLGEGAAVFALEKMTDSQIAATPDAPIILEAVGLGFEQIASKTGISAAGNHFQMAIREALRQSPFCDPVDLAILHAPGTVAGDEAERNALAAVFEPRDMPLITSNKFLLGHTLGASAALSLEYGIHILRHQQYLPLPYPNLLKAGKSPPIQRILITAAGFGGNAAAVIIRRG